MRGTIKSDQWKFNQSTKVDWTNKVYLMKEKIILFLSQIKPSTSELSAEWKLILVK